MYHPVIKVKVYNEDLVFGPGLIVLLKHIQNTSSMKDACAEMGMSYSKGWKIVNRAEKELGFGLITRQHGGIRGGNCSVTGEGILLMKRYDQMEQEIVSMTQTAFEKYFPEYAEKPGFDAQNQNSGKKAGK